MNEDKFQYEEVTTRLSSHQEDIERLDSIPGIATRMAEQILAEVGTDVEKHRSLMKCFRGVEVEYLQLIIVIQVP